MLSSYEDVLRQILSEGGLRHRHVGNVFKSLFSTRVQFDLTQPVLPIRGLSSRLLHEVSHELIWRIQGGSDISYLRNMNVHHWTKYADSDDNVQLLEDKNWRHWVDVEAVMPERAYHYINHGYTLTGTVKRGPFKWFKRRQRLMVMRREEDQLRRLIRGLGERPEGQHLLQSWIVDTVDQYPIDPVSSQYQFYIDDTYGLHCHYHTPTVHFPRMAEHVLISAILFCRVLVEHTNYSLRSLIWSIGDAHIQHPYDEDMVRSYLKTFEGTPAYTLDIRPMRRLERYTPNNFQFKSITDYEALML